MKHYVLKKVFTNDIDLFFLVICCCTNPIMLCDLGCGCAIVLSVTKATVEKQVIKRLLLCS